MWRPARRQAGTGRSGRAWMSSATRPGRGVGRAARSCA